MYFKEIKLSRGGGWKSTDMTTQDPSGCYWKFYKTFKEEMTPISYTHTHTRLQNIED